MDGLHHHTRVLVETVRVFVEANDVRRVLRELDIARSGDAHSLFGVRGHLLRVDINCARLCLEDLVLPPADLRAPLLSVHVEHAARLFRIDQDRPCVPTVFNGQAV